MVRDLAAVTAYGMAPALPMSQPTAKCWCKSSWPGTVPAVDIPMLEYRARSNRSSGQSRRCDRSRSRSHFRLRVNERLERPRHSSLGISTARPVPGQKLLHQHLALGRDAGSAGTVSQTVAEARSRTIVLPSREKRFHLRYPTGSEIADGEDEITAPDYADEFPKSLLERFPTAHASHR